MNYANFHNELPASVRDKLKPIVCQSCKDNGEGWVGTCKKCLENQAWNREWLETHTFVFDDRYRGYHSDSHNLYKSMPKRLPNEHPYLYYGIEIEVEFDSDVVNIYNGCDDDYYDDDDNWKINDILEKFSEITDGLFVYESDSSLNNGVEMITPPCSYAFLTSKDTVDKLQRGFEFLQEHGAYLDQPDTNGLHIHISRKFFDFGSTQLVDRQIAYQGIDWLFQKFQPEIEQLGCRHYTGYCQSKADMLKENLENHYLFSQYNVDTEVKCHLKKGGEVPRGDHHVAVTLSGNTIEARVFKSTIDYKKVLAYVEIMRNMAHAVRDDNIDTTFNSLMHTKDNLYLDDLLAETRRKCKKSGEEFDLDRLNDNTIEIIVKKESRY